MGASIILSLVLVTSVIAETTNLESKENLKLETKVELKDVSEITSKHNPVDIYKLGRLKIEQEKYDDAVFAFFVGTAYGTYDMRRVGDDTDILRKIQIDIGTGVTEETREQFDTTVKALLENPDKLIAFLRKVGKPDYHPTYMIAVSYTHLTLPTILLV